MLLPHRLLLTFGLIVLGGLALAQPAWAGDFKADYAIDYTLNPQTGLTHVKQRVTLTNQAPNLRASSYSLTLDKDGYQNLTAADSKGKIAVKEAKAEDGTPTLTFTFNDRVVGVGNKLAWTIDYDSPTLIQKHGQIWDVTIPRVKESQSYDIGNFSARLIIPKSAGPEAYVSPTTNQTGHTDTDYMYTFSKEHILPTGIVAAFGQAQVFKFTLKYHLHNPNIGRASTEIALPPDIAGYQQIVYDQLSPQPVSMKADSDGNTLATYYLNSRDDLDVTFTGWARISQSQKKLDSTQLASDLPKDIVTKYTVEQKYWETSNADLIKKTKEITDPNKPVAVNAKAIYDYVTSTLQYNTARINKDLTRMGAAVAYQDQKNAVCMEFTDLFVTMSRIAGIPAREIDGYAYTPDTSNQPIFYPGLGSDILHAWAQVYLPEAGWVMVDPTWGSTTGGINYFGRVDLDRIGFAVKGVSSQTPYAAGSYKTNDEQDGDVKVEFSSEAVQPKTGVTMAIKDVKVISGIGSNIPLQLTNTGNVALYQLNLTYHPSQPLTFSRQPAGTAEVLLPGQTLTEGLPLRTDGWLNQATADMKVTLVAADATGTAVNSEQSFNLEVGPFFGVLMQPALGLILLFLAAIVGGWYGLHHLYNRQRRSATATVTEPATATASPSSKSRSAVAKSNP